MEYLMIALTVGLFLFLVAAIIGLIKPELVKQKTRGKAFLANFIPAIVAFILIGIFAPDENAAPSLSEDSVQVAENDESKSEVTSNASKNIDLVVSSLSENYAIEAEYSFGDKYCFNDNYCEAMVGAVKIQTMGYIAEALPSSKVSPEFYQSVCSAIFIALSGANKELAEQTVFQTFNFAAQNGQAKSNVSGVDINIRPTSDSLLACKYVKP